jgi:predicted ATP-grasp superfamily ATP-dependent carboligase
METDQTMNWIEYLTHQRDRGIFIWLCNIGAEKYWNKAGSGVTDRIEETLVNRVEEMNLLICREQDIMILRQLPDQDYLEALMALGFSIPRIVTPASVDPLTPISELLLKDENLMAELAEIGRNHPDVYFVPYAVTYLEEQIAANCGLKMIGAPAHINAAINDKIGNREISERLGLPCCKGRVCHTMDEIRQEYSRLTNTEPFFEKVIIKEPFGASGKGLYIIESPDRLEITLTRLARFSRNKPESMWLVEGWYRKIADVNYQIYVSPAGAVNTFSIKQQVLRDTVYIGSRVPPELPREVLDAYLGYGEQIGRYLFQMGYSGVAGIDSIITAADEVIPIIEINGRFTLSTYISFIANVLGEVRFLTRYYGLNSRAPIGYQELTGMLESRGLLYRKGQAAGVMIYTAGTLPSLQTMENNSYRGRIFALIIGADWETINEYSGRMDGLIRELCG